MTPPRRRIGTWALVAALAAAAAAVPLGGAATQASATTAVTLQESFSSHALGRPVPFLIQLPPGYATSGLRYPVIYFLHGLPASPTSYQGGSWVGQLLARLGLEAIVVAPQGASAGQSDPEYYDWGPGENWATALTSELPRYVDAHYRTIASRTGRALVGLSAGGYGAAVLGLHHPAEYSVVESWSGYFRATDPTGEKTLDLGSDAANAYANMHRLVPRLRAQFSRYPTFLAFYVGRSDPTFVPDNLSFDRQLTAGRVPHVFALYRGGHSSALWNAEAPRWLGLALSHLHPATRAA